jgi:hypothetical protein
MYLLVYGDSNAAVTNNTVSLAHVTITGNTASALLGTTGIGLFLIRVGPDRSARVAPPHDASPGSPL